MTREERDRLRALRHGASDQVIRELLDALDEAEAKKAQCSHASAFVVERNGIPDEIYPDRPTAERWSSFRSLSDAYDLNGHAVRRTVVEYVRIDKSLVRELAEALGGIVNTSEGRARARFGDWAAEYQQANAVLAKVKP